MQIPKCSTASSCHLVSGAPLLALGKSSLTKITEIETIGLCTPTTKEGKGKMLDNELFTSVSMFWSLQIMMHGYSGTSDIS